MSLGCASDVGDGLHPSACTLFQKSGFHSSRMVIWSPSDCLWLTSVVQVCHQTNKAPAPPGVHPRALHWVCYQNKQHVCVWTPSTADNTCRCWISNQTFQSNPEHIKPKLDQLHPQSAVEWRCTSKQQSNMESRSLMKCRWQTETSTWSYLHNATVICCFCEISCILHLK